MTVSFADPFDIAQFSKKYSVILKGKRPRGYVLTGKRLRVLWRDLQVAVCQQFNRNQSCGFHNSENT